MTDAPTPAALSRLEDWARKARKAGIVAAVPLFAGFFVDGAQFFRSYLFAFLVWAGLGIGCFSLFLMHSLTGGGWGKPIRRILEAGAKTLPLVALMFVPVLAGIGSLYEWSHGDVVDHDAILTHKKAYLNVPFFILRAAFYFAVWIVFARVLLALGRRYEANADARMRWHRARVAAGGILAYVMTMTFAAIDWGMSLEAHWFSTIYGLHFVVGQALGGFAVAILVAG